MALDRYASFPSQAAGSFGPSTTTGQSVAFGFNAGLVKLTNDGGGTVYVNLGSTVGSTDGYPLSSGESLEVHSIPSQVHGFGLALTSTANTLRYGAWG